MWTRTDRVTSLVLSGSACLRPPDLSAATATSAIRWDRSLATRFSPCLSDSNWPTVSVRCHVRKLPPDTGAPLRPCSRLRVLLAEQAEREGADRRAREEVDLI